MPVTARPNERKQIIMIFRFSGIWSLYTIHVGIATTMRSVRMVRPMVEYAPRSGSMHFPGKAGSHAFATGVQMNAVVNGVTSVNPALIPKMVHKANIIRGLGDRSLIKVSRKEALMRPRIGLKRMLEMYDNLRLSSLSMAPDGISQ